MEAHVALLTWNHACMIGVRAMDDQHGILMDTLNDQATVPGFELGMGAAVGDVN